MILWNTEQGKIFTYPLPHSLQKATLQKTGSLWTEGPLVNGPWNIISHWNAVLCHNCSREGNLNVSDSKSQVNGPKIIVANSQWHLFLKCLCQCQFQWVLPLYQNNDKTNIEHCWGFCNKGFGLHRFPASLFFNYYLKRQTALTCGIMFQNNFTQLVKTSKNQIVETILGLLLNDGLWVKAICWDCTSVYFNLQSCKLLQF